MNSAQFNIVETDLSFSPTLPGKGIIGVLGPTERGPVNNPETLITSWPMFHKYFGNLTADDFTNQCKIALEGGAKLRVCRILHYTDLTTNTISAVTAGITATQSVTNTAADLKSGDSVVTTINGTPAAAVTWQGTHNATMAAIAASILATFPTLITSVEIIPSTTPGGPAKVMVMSVKAGATISSFTMVTTGAATVAVFTKTAISNIQNSSAAQILGLTPKGPGTSYNNLVATVKRPTDGISGHFDLTLTILGDAQATETYKNLYLSDNDALGTQPGLLSLVNSALVNVTLPTTLVGTTTLQRTPVFGAWGYGSGTAGGAIVTSDYVGNATYGLGLSAFDKYDDMVSITAPMLGVSDTGFSTSLTSYVENRKDLVGFIHVDNSYTTAPAIATARQATAINSSYIAFYGGGLKILSSLSGSSENVSEIGKVLSLMAKTHLNHGEHYSFAGVSRGRINGALGVVNNLGGPANRADLDMVANNQVNMVILRNNQTMLWGNFTGQTSTSALSFLSVRMLLIAMKKTLGPFLNQFLEEPNDFVTWRKMFYAIKPYLDSLKTNRAIFEYSWQGDQFANTLDDLVINNATDVGLGKYKIRLYLKDVVSLQDIYLNIITTPAGVTFDEAAQLL